MMALTIKSWTGSSSERFTHEDMDRITSNANSLASSLGMATVSFNVTSRASQFDYREAAKLESLLSRMGSLLGLTIPTVGWAAGRPLSCIDFNRWEQACSSIQTAMAADGRHTLRIMSGHTDVSHLISWTAYKNGGEWMSGDSFEGDIYLRVEDGEYGLTFSSFGATASTPSLKVTSNSVYNLSPGLSVLSISCDRTMNTVDIAGTVLEVDGTSLKVGMLRQSTALTVSADVVNDSPSYTGVASGLLWEYVATAEVAPSALDVAVPLTAVRTGIPLYVATDGTLVLPRLAKFDLIAIGGGQAGEMGYSEQSITSSDYRYNGQGGRGGGVAMLTAESLSGSISIAIGAGGVGTLSSAHGTPGDTVVTGPDGTVLMTAKGGGGAGGGGAWWTTKDDGKGGSKGTAGGAYTGGGGGSYGAAGGAGGTGGGKGGTASAGSDGTIIDGKGYGGAAYLSTGGGGGGGYGADGGDGASRAGGGGGGVLGGDGGDAPAGGLGYGAGGGGSYVLYTAGGGGGGGLGTVKLAGDGTNRGASYTSEGYQYYLGGNGAPGALRITFSSLI